ncbi:hypothetical protein B0H17DRAFT_961598, partial [Mycena rosella]
RHPLVIVDQDGRIVCVFVGKPDDPEWDTKVFPGAFRAMERASRKGLKSGALTELDRLHRRGNFLALTAGVSFGGGQKVSPSIDAFQSVSNQASGHLAHDHSGAFTYWAPKVYREYADVLRQLFEKYPGFEHNFRNSIFPAATFNCSPDTVAAEHTDYGNNPAGWCAITSRGHFNHKRGAHLHMRQFKLLVEFPSGTSALVLSGAVNHGNTPIAADETRFSMTQYAVGGLFRWVRYSFMTAKALLAQKGGKELRDASDGVPGSRWQWTLNLFSKFDEVAADRHDVFA